VVLKFGKGISERSGIVPVSSRTLLFRSHLGIHPVLKALSSQQRGAEMPLRALAFHPGVALEKLHEFFADEAAQMHASTSSGVCACCGLEFTIVSVNKTERLIVNIAGSFAA
jgi:hypothetical protein